MGAVAMTEEFNQPATPKGIIAVRRSYDLPFEIVNSSYLFGIRYRYFEVVKKSTTWLTVEEPVSLYFPRWQEISYETVMNRINNQNHKFMARHWLRQLWWRVRNKILFIIGGFKR